MLFYENTLENKANWLKVKTEGVQCNKDGFGSMIKAYSNGISWIHEIEGSSSHASQNSSIAHFGFGAYEQIDSLFVYWPNGNIQKFLDISTNQTLLIIEGETAPQVVGCTDPEAENYNPAATYNSGCYKRIYGCTDPEADNFSLEANVDNGSCKYNTVYGCTDPLSSNYNPNANIDDGSCEYITSLEPSLEDETQIQIYPNPASKLITIEISSDKKVSMDFLLFDLQGHRVFKKMDAVSETSEMRLPVLRSGMYFYELTVRGSTVKYGKLVIQ